MSATRGEHLVKIVYAIRKIGESNCNLDISSTLNTAHYGFVLTLTRVNTAISFGNFFHENAKRNVLVLFILNDVFS